MAFDDQARATEVRSRSWTFTLNNYVEADIVRIIDFNPKYCVIGKEVGESGTKHLQGYITFEHKKSFKQLKGLIPRSHIETAKGTAEQNYVYCTKDGDFVEHGVRPPTPIEKSQRAKQRYLEQWNLAKAGNYLELPPAQIKTWEYIHQKFKDAPQDLPALQNIWIHGATGTGKSSLVRKIPLAFYSKPMSKWWDGYDGESVIVLDDFAPEHGKFLGYFLKIWADHYAFNAEVKGGMLKIRPKHFIVTSQYNLEDCFEDHQTVLALNRRFAKIDMNTVCFTDDEFINKFN